MELKIFSPAQQKVPLYTVRIDKVNMNNVLTLFIDDRHIMETLTIDETQIEVMKASLREIMILDVNKFKQIIKHLNPYFRKYARDLLAQKKEKYQEIIRREERNLENLKGEAGEYAQRQRNLAYVLINEAQDVIKSLL